MVTSTYCCKLQRAAVWWLVLSLVVSSIQAFSKPSAPYGRGTTAEKQKPSHAPERLVIRKDDKEFQWLNAIYRVWRQQPVGTLDDSTLRQMVPAISAWARRKSPVAAQRAQELLERYVQESLAGNTLAAPQKAHFNAVMDGWAKSESWDAPQKVQAIIKWMQALRNDHQLFHLQPDVISLSTLVAAWAKSRVPVAAEKAEAVLQYMENKQQKPNTITYNAALHALVFCPDRDKALRVDTIIKRMEERYSKGHVECRPDVYSYQSLISAWSRTGMAGAAQKAEQVLQHIDRRSKEGEPHLEPNVHCYTAAIHAWSNSMERQKARRAYLILQHMRELHEAQQKQLPQQQQQEPLVGQKQTTRSAVNVKPNVVAFTAVINACGSPADTSENEAAFAIAQLAMEELRHSNYGNPNFLTYSTFLNVCATTLPADERRDEVVRQVFEECCRDGQVGYIVIEKLHVAASSQLYRELMSQAESADPEFRMDTLKLPAEWTRNVRGERDPSSRQLKETSYDTQKLNKTAQEQLKRVQMLQGLAGHYSKQKGTDEEFQLLWQVDKL